jgi:hypothetical protein
MSSLTPIFPVCCAICCVFVVGYCCATDLLRNCDRASRMPPDQKGRVGKHAISSTTNARGQISSRYGFKSGFIYYYLVINESTLTPLFQQLVQILLPRDL